MKEIWTQANLSSSKQLVTLKTLCSLYATQFVTSAPSTDHSIVDLLTTIMNKDAGFYVVLLVIAQRAWETAAFGKQVTKADSF